MLMVVECRLPCLIEFTLACNSVEITQLVFSDVLITTKIQGEIMLRIITASFRGERRYSSPYPNRKVHSQTSGDLSAKHQSSVRTTAHRYDSEISMAPQGSNAIDS